MGMNELPPNEVDQAIDIVQEWEEKLGFSDDEKNNLDKNIWAHSRVILAMAAEIDRLENSNKINIQVWQEDPDEDELKFKY